MASPYHPGEIAVQKRLGVREQARELDGMFFDSMPGAAAGFLAEHTFAVLSSQDAEGNVWASPLAGAPGIFSVPDSHVVDIHLDRLEPRLDKSLMHGPLGGLLVMHFDRRLRIRINGTLERAGDVLKVQISQFYGNCTKYIQRRVATAQRAEESMEGPPSAALTNEHRALISRADTFFIATLHPEGGADASHRGGRPGFVTAFDERTVVFPDYRGNNMFNTLGNLESDPRAGLLFIDFESGASLQLTGKATAQFRDPTTFAPTGRSIRFDIAAVRELAPAAALRYALVEPFPYNPPVE